MHENEAAGNSSITGYLQSAKERNHRDARNTKRTWSSESLKISKAAWHSLFHSNVTPFFSKLCKGQAIDANPLINLR